MHRFKFAALFLTIVCLVATAVAIIGTGKLDQDQLQAFLTKAGLWAPILYILLYTLGTLLVLPSTALNLTGGAIFGPGFGLLWTSIGAVLAAAVAFIFARTAGRNIMSRRLAGRWQAMDAELSRGAVFYMFAIRLVPILPYGLVNFAAGLTSIRFQDYLLGTTLGTVPSVLPFVLLGSSGVQAVQTGDILPLLGALMLTGLLVAGTTWYRRRSMSN
ncbi:MAG: TVP38/TMEM64 family protein [Cyanobacteria bacterium P01_D01_bin.115]